MRICKLITLALLMSIVTFFMFSYMCTINMYKEIKDTCVSNNEIIRLFDLNEKKYDKIIKNYIEGVGNSSLHNNQLGKEKLDKLKNILKEYAIEELRMEIINKKNKECEDDNNYTYRKVICSMYCTGYFNNIIEKLCIRQFRIDKSINKIVENIYDEAIYFPIAELKSIKGTYPFENSWQMARNYGGNRKHEGTDIMYSENKEDVVPIVSISDGVIEKKGWLELGGYRLLIKVNDNIRFYYAHLSSYAKGLKEGNNVKAGQLLGYMGSTGYGKEGTKGKFDVHLHFGMYYIDDKNEVGINPYFLLKMLKFNKLCYK